MPVLILQRWIDMIQMYYLGFNWTANSLLLFYKQQAINFNKHFYGGIATNQ
jgi:hypothetical protein